jgi:hypothetical protein
MESDRSAAERQTDSSTERITFLVDSGASRHIITSGRCLINITKCGRDLVTADGSKHHVEYSGDLCGHARLQNGAWRSVVLSNVWTVPTFTHNLLSAAQLLEQRVSLHWDPSGGYLSAENCNNTRPQIYQLRPDPRNIKLRVFEVVGRIQRQPRPTHQAAAAAPSSEHNQPHQEPPIPRAAPENLWHQRLGHPGEGAITEMIKHKLIRSTPNSGPQEACEACLIGKSHRDAVNRGAASRATEPVGA